MAGKPAPVELFLWRLERKIHIDTWDSGIGAELGGGRWNSKGQAAVYGSFDASTAILEVAAHKGFKTLDTIPHTLLCAHILDPSLVYEVRPEDVPNQNWLVPGSPGHGQQSFGDKLLNEHPFIIVPSTVSKYSWNIVMNPVTALGRTKCAMSLRRSFGWSTIATNKTCWKC